MARNKLGLAIDLTASLANTSVQERFKTLRVSSEEMIAKVVSLNE